MTMRKKSVAKMPSWVIISLEALNYVIFIILNDEGVIFYLISKLSMPLPVLSMSSASYCIYLINYQDLKLGNISIYLFLANFTLDHNNFDYGGDSYHPNV